MEYRPLEITVVSAKDLKNVNLFSKMDVYAFVSINGDPITKKRTPIDKNSGSNPSWNFTMNLAIDESAALQNRLNLVFQLRSARSLGDKDIGEVHVPIKELLEKIGNQKSPQFVTYQVRKPSGKPKGELNFSYKFGEKFSKPEFKAAAATKGGDEPVTAYPAPAAAGTSSGYPPPQYGAAPGAYPPPGGYPPAGYPPGGYGGHQPPQQMGYGGYPPQGAYHQQPPPGYGYPQQGGYGYPPQGMAPPKKNKFGGGGMGGMGMGLGAGLLGGLLVGDMISDMGSYDAGYDAGFDDGGFDF